MERLEHWLDRYERGVIDRRAFLAGAAAALQALVAGAAARPGLVTPAGIHHVELKTVDLAKTTEFYEALLGPATVANERATIPLEPGGGRGHLRISRGPIPRTDHFAIKVPGMSARDPKAMRARLEKNGLRVRQVEASLYIKGPDDLEVELVAPSVR
jgi:catechol 2,3-dioxygenase-like lactoylglutathione lyase family enzyme